MIAHQSHNSTVPITALTVGSEYTLMLTDAVVVHKDQQMNADTSFCNISSLEVYRGREQVIEISHQGFSLTENGTIEVQHTLCVGGGVNYI